MELNAVNRHVTRDNLPQLMKAIRAHARGGPEQLVYEDAPMPVLRADDALVKVFATGITPAELSWSETYANSDGSPRTPSIPGHEVSGVVEQLGPSASPDLRVGDEVYGLTDFTRDGAAAEYIAVRAQNLAFKPRAMDHVHAAAVPLSALTAWQAFFDHAKLTSGQRALIHGGAGGVGTFAVQLARWRGAEVITTASARDREFLLQLGAHNVLDYRTERFEEKLSDIDIVLDTIGGATLQRSWQVLRTGGIIVTLPGPVPEGTTSSTGRAIFFIVEPNRHQLTELARLIDGGKIRSIVGQVFSLGEARRAYEYTPNGASPGKTILRVTE